MTPTDIKLMMAELAPVIREFTLQIATQTVAPILLRLEGVEKQFATFPVPRDGIDADPEKVASIVKGQISADLEDIRQAIGSLTPSIESITKDFTTRLDAIPEVPIIDIDAVAAAITLKIEAKANDERASVAAFIEKIGSDLQKKLDEDLLTAVRGIPVPKDGANVDPFLVEELVSKYVEKAVAAIPPAIGIADALIDRSGELILNKQNGETIRLGQVVGKDADPVAIAKMVEDAVSKIPAPAAGKDADPEMIKSMVTAAVAELPVPQDGKSVSIEEVEPILMEKVGGIIESAVQKAIEAIPAPKDGVSINIEDLVPLMAKRIDDFTATIVPPRDGRDVDPEAIKSMVAAAVAEIPVAKDGKDVDPEEIAGMVRDAVAALPVPQDGKDVDIETVKTLVRDAVAEIPAPKDGVDVDPIEVEKMVEAAVAKIPVPKDGKDVDLDVIKGIIVDEVAKIPAPKDGVSVDVDAVAKMVVDEVSKIPVPKDGKDIDPEIVRHFVAEEVSKGLEDAIAAIPTPKDGKDVDPETVKALVDAAVKAIPAPQDGKSIDPADIKSMVDEAVAQLPAPKNGEDADPLVVEKMVNEAVAKLPPAKDGKDIEPEAVRSIIEELVSKIPVPRDGRDIEPEAVEKMVRDAIAAIPAPKDGVDVDMERVESVIKSEIASAVAQIPVPKDGVSIEMDEVVPVIERLVSKMVGDIPIPKDGVGASDAMIDREGRLKLTMADGKLVDLGLVQGRDADMAMIEKWIDDRFAKLPVPKDGLDGVGFDDLDVVDTDEGFMLRFVKGENKKQYRLPLNIDRGVFKEGKTYGRGDGVTYAGCYWIAQTDGPQGKPDTGSGWRLGVKKGRDGKDGQAPKSLDKSPIRLR